MEQALVGTARSGSEAPGRAALRADLERLARQLGSDGDPGDTEAVYGGWPPVAAGEEDAALLGALRAALGALARAHGLGPQTDPGTASLVAAALDGAQLSARCELLTGDEEAIRALLPGLVYSVVSPLAGPAAAGPAAARSAALLTAA